MPYDSKDTAWDYILIFNRAYYYFRSGGGGGALTFENGDAVVGGDFGFQKWVWL